MTTMTASILKQAFSVRWKPSKDLAVVALSWLLVVGSLYTATVIVGSGVWGGMAGVLVLGKSPQAAARLAGDPAPLNDAEWRACFAYADGPDHRRGVQAFLQGTDPVFTGE